MNKLLKLMLAGFVLIGISMSAIATIFGFGGHSWKEEVLLHDGRKIIVERYIKRGGRSEVGQQPSIREQSLTFTMPETKKAVTWGDPFSKDLGTANFLPMLLDIHNGWPYLVVYPMGCLSYNKWGRPNPPYVVFKNDGKEWNRIPLPNLPAVLKTPNLIFSSPDEEAKKLGKIISSESIRALYSSYRQPEFGSILREPLSKERCPQYSSGPKAPNPIVPNISGK